MLEYSYNKEIKQGNTKSTCLYCKNRKITQLFFKAEKLFTWNNCIL